jgi:hypothetical protein
MSVLLSFEAYRHLHVSTVVEGTLFGSRQPESRWFRWVPLVLRRRLRQQSYGITCHHHTIQKESVFFFFSTAYNALLAVGKRGLPDK